MATAQVDVGRIIRRSLWGLAVIPVVMAVWMYVMPMYEVYQAHMAGRAKLAEAEYSKQVLVQDAKARLESAKSLADAEVERARGVAKANEIIGDSLKGNEDYLHYLWIHNLEAGNNEVIYVPTETGMPIFEAGSRLARERKPKVMSGDPGTAEHPDATTEHRKPAVEAKPK